MVHFRCQHTRKGLQETSGNKCLEDIHFSTQPCLISWSRLASNTYPVHLAMEFPTGTLLASDPQNSQYWKCIISSTWFEISQKFVSTSLPRKKVQDILDHFSRSDARNIREDFATVYLTLQRGNDGNRHFFLEGNESQPLNPMLGEIPSFVETTRFFETIDTLGNREAFRKLVVKFVSSCFTRGVIQSNCLFFEIVPHFPWLVGDWLHRFGCKTLEDGCLWVIREDSFETCVVVTIKQLWMNSFLNVIGAYIYI